MDDGFHRIPLVPGFLKALQHVLPCVVGAAQRHLSNEVNSFGCAAQSDRRGRADTQLRINWTTNPPAAARVPCCLTRACCRSLPRR